MVYILSSVIAVLMLFFQLEASAQTPESQVSCIIRWIAPEKDTQGNPFNTSEIAKYRVYVREATQNYEKGVYQAETQDLHIDCQKAGFDPYEYVAVTAVTRLGAESGFSNEMRYVVPEPPGMLLLMIGP